MKYLAYSGLFNFVASAFMGTVVLAKNPKTSQSRSFLYFTFFASVFSLGYFFWQLSDNPADAIFWFKILCSGIILINVTYLHFTFSLTGVLNKKIRELAAFYSVSIGFVILNLRMLLYSGVEQRYGLGFWPIPTTLFSAFLVFWFFECFYGFYWLVKSYILSNGLRKEQLKYVTVAVVIGFFGGATNWPMWYGIPIIPYLNILVSIYIIIIAYAILKYRLMDIRIAVTRAGIILVLYTAILGLPFYVGYKTNSWLMTAVCMFVLASAGPIIYRFAQKKAENLLLAEQKRYQKVLLQAASGMAHEHDLNRLTKLIVYIVKRTVNVSFAAILLEDREKKIYKMMAARDNGALRKTEYTLPCEHPFIKYLNRKSAPVVFEEIPADIQNSIVFPGRISLVVPSDSDGDPIGFLLLGEKLNGKVYSSDDINVFNILAQQTALAIENCMFIREFKLTQEKLFSAEKLASIGGLAEGVAHQVNNRLNHFSMAAGEMRFELETFVEGHRQLIESNADFKKTFDYLKELTESINGNVRRTDGILKGILNYARIESRESMFTTFPVKEIVDLSVDLLKIKHHLPADFSVRIAPCESDAVYGVKSQLLECIYNIIDNAYEATLDKQSMLKEQEKDQYRTDISLEITQKIESVVLQFSDNGIGIRKEQHQKIFAPFFTTKSSYKSGTGIGMYVVKRMIEENHHGRIWFSSEFGVGTHIFMELPKRAI